MVRLQDLEGYRPLATVSSIDKDVQQRGSAYVANSALMGNLVIDTEEIEAIASRDAEALRQSQGVADYIGRLVADFSEADSGSGFSIPGLERTALTDMFAERYDVAVSELERHGSLRLYGKAHPNQVLSLDYQVWTPGRAQAFWQVHADGSYGFANMYCVYDSLLPAPLAGEGNIAFIPGVAEALTADIGLLISGNPRTT